jgi:hypothetical protein
MRLILAVLAAIIAGPSMGQDTCEGFISAQCCCTSGACFVIPRSAIIRLDEKRYRIIRTGEIVEAKGSSPDGLVRRCTFDNHDGQFVRIGHPDARTSCLYVTETGS